MKWDGELLAKACADDENVYVEVISVGSIGASSCGEVCEIRCKLFGVAIGHGDVVVKNNIEVRAFSSARKGMKVNYTKFQGRKNMIVKTCGLFARPRQTLLCLLYSLHHSPMTIVYILTPVHILTAENSPLI